jgi:hypothetical protein
VTPGHCWVCPRAAQQHLAYHLSQAASLGQEGGLLVGGAGAAEEQGGAAAGALQQQQEGRQLLQQHTHQQLQGQAALSCLHLQSFG